MRLNLIVMGVCGTGKSTVAAGLGAALGLACIEGDDLHSAASVAKMRDGIALADDDRWPWLDRVGTALADAASAPTGAVASCSALRRVYRERLRAACPGLRFIFLDGTETLIAARMGRRSGHYMPTTLLTSQLQTLERPGVDEAADVLRLDIDQPAEALIQAALQALRPGGRFIA
jgi:gluconokinase